MPTRRYLQLDVFSAHPGAGNPLGVIVDAEGLDAAAMQAPMPDVFKDFSF